MRVPTDQAVQQATVLFRLHGGTMRTSEAVSAGIQKRTLYWMRDQGLLEVLSRGVFHLASEPLPEKPDVVAVVRRVPTAVVALLSALDIHELTTQIPDAVYVALPQGVKHPRIAFPRVHAVHMNDAAMVAGVEQHRIGPTLVPVFGVAKTIADCFKFRSLVGIEIAVEALQEVVRSRRATPAELMESARVDRVARVMDPFLKALL